MLAEIGRLLPAAFAFAFCYTQAVILVGYVFYFKSITVIILTSELVAVDTVRNKTSIRLTPKRAYLLKN